MTTNIITLMLSAVSHDTNSITEQFNNYYHFKIANYVTVHLY